MDLGQHWASLCRRSPLVDHLSRALTRYVADSSDRYAAAITYYGFLCVFPLLLLAGALVGLVVGSDPDRQRRLLSELGDFVPDTLANTLVQVVTDRAGITGALGVAGLVVAGLGWVDTLRESVRTVWHQESHRGHILRKKVHDLAILAGLGLTVLASMAVSAIALSVTAEGVALVGLPEDDPLATAAVRIVALAVAVACDTAILTYLLLWLPRTAEPLWRVVRAAVVGGVLLELAKYVGFYWFAVLLRQGADLYGATLAAALGLLLWINVAARILMLTSAWAVTAPGRTDVAPSGTAPETSREQLAEGSDDEGREAEDSGTEGSETEGNETPGSDGKD